MPKERKRRHSGGGPPAIKRPRTLDALGTLAGLMGFDGEHLKVNGRSYLPINHTLNFGDASLPSLLVSVGKNREMILLDMHAPELESLYQEFHEESGFSRSHTFVEKLEAVTRFIRSKFEDTDIGAVVDNPPKKSKLNERFPAVPLAEFLEHRYCRHDVLWNAYFVHKLIQAKLLLAGDVFVRRETMSTRTQKQVGHAWLEYWVDDDLYLIDSTLQGKASITKVEPRVAFLKDSRSKFYPEQLAELYTNMEAETQPLDSSAPCTLIRCGSSA